MEINYHNLKIGDRLVRTKGGLLSKHHVLYAGLFNGQHLIAENQVDYGVRYITLDEFLNEGKLVRVEYYNFDDNSQATILDRINKKIGANTKYVLFTYNCEHFVNEIINGVAKSKQIQKGIVLGIGALVTLYFLKNRIKKI